MTKTPPGVYLMKSMAKVVIHVNPLLEHEIHVHVHGQMLENTLCGYFKVTTGIQHALWLHVLQRNNRNRTCLWLLQSNRRNALLIGKDHQKQVLAE